MCGIASWLGEKINVSTRSEILIGVGDFKKLGVDAARHSDLTWTEEMMLINQKSYLQDDILGKVDRASISVLLETRVPLLTHALVEWNWSIPLSYKINEDGDHGKQILR